MAPKHHPTPLSGGDRKALKKELSKSRAMTHIFAERSAEKRSEGEALIREADNLSCQSWNERMWSDGGPIDPSPTIDQAINGGYPMARWLFPCAVRHWHFHFVWIAVRSTLVAGASDVRDALSRTNVRVISPISIRLVPFGIHLSNQNDACATVWMKNMQRSAVDF